MKVWTVVSAERHGQWAVGACSTPEAAESMAMAASAKGFGGWGMFVVASEVDQELGADGLPVDAEDKWRYFWNVPEGVKP